MSAFRTKIRAQATKARLYVGVSIAYARGAASVTIAHAVKFPPRKRAAFDTVAVDLTAQDWGILVSELILSSVAVQPARGDVITFTEDSITSTFEVLPDEGDATYHLTAGDSQYRIHTKRITEAAAS